LNLLSTLTYKDLKDKDFKEICAPESDFSINLRADFYKADFYRNA
jgi:hypothetical protein